MTVWVSTEVRRQSFFAQVPVSGRVSVLLAHCWTLHFHMREQEH